MEDIKPAVTPVQKTSWGKRFLRKFFLFAAIAFILYIGISYLLAAVLVYSSGDRIGYIYKFLHKGYIFKTNEGILKTGFVNIGNTTTPNEEWNFSVADDSVASQITHLDQRVAVKLYYKEYYTKLFFRGDTKYFVYKMEKMPNQ
ncbi:hypothetical protein [Ferruginibacter sp.]